MLFDVDFEVISPKTHKKYLNCCIFTTLNFTSHRFYYRLYYRLGTHIICIDHLKEAI